MPFYAGQKVHAVDMELLGLRCYSTGIGLTTIASGATGVLTFDTIIQTPIFAPPWSTPDISVYGTNNSKITFNTPGEYRYGWCARVNHTSTPGSANTDMVLFARLNGTTRLATRIIKPVLAATVFYIGSAADTRTFAAGDYIEIVLTNNLSVSVFETSASEITHVWAKRTLGP